MTKQEAKRPVVLCILDGWGHRDETENNAIAQARTPNWDRLLQEHPHALLDASAQEVGLPAGQMGNSEVGHMNLGAGRIVMQDLPRIDAAIEDGSIKDNPAIGEFVSALEQSGGTAHVMGLLSPGGVHSHQKQFAALVRVLVEAGLPVVVHAFLDGRDTPPRSAIEYLKQFESDIAGDGDIRFGAVSGRYYAMDRDKRWERTALAYDALVTGDGERAADAATAVEAGYRRGESDEFVRPTAIGDYSGMRDGDGVLMINFRADRAREILTALLDPAFDGFERSKTVEFAAALGMTHYSAALDGLMKTIFPPQPLTDTLGEVVSKAGLKQLRIAETEKYAHVTFFLNGGKETVYDGEERILVPSPKVATYDLQPEMSAPEVTERLVSAVETGTFDLIVANYANTDMVGHTGDLEAAKAAVEAVDAALGRLGDAVSRVSGALLITADHGNAEMMSDTGTGQAHTAHTSNLVPLVVAGADTRRAPQNGRLADVAPTILALMGLPQPKEMTGRNLLSNDAAAMPPLERRASA